MTDIPNAPLSVGVTPDPVDRALEPLLGEPFASAWALAAPATDRDSPSHPVRDRLLGRAALSRVAARPMFTARRARLPPERVAPGVQARTLYVADEDRAKRPGEPVRARLVELSPASDWSGPAPGHHREWLVLQGSIRLGDEVLRPRDFHRDPAGSAARPVASQEGALVFLRESTLTGTSGEQPFTVRDADAGWDDYAPGIQRRVLWQGQGQAALLYYAQPGSRVPAHGHGHDEECLMVQGELFLDDILLQAGDYQLAPAGTGHRVTETDTGVVIYAHGDLDLQFVG